MEVILIESSAFHQLIQEVVQKMKEDHKIQDRWIPPEAAMKMLNITSRSYLQTLRDAGKIRYTQPAKRIILYDRESILTYLDSHAKNTF